MIGAASTAYRALPASVRMRIRRALVALAVVLLSALLLGAGYLIAFRDGQAAGRRERQPEIDGLRTEQATRATAQARALVEAQAAALRAYAAQVQRGHALTTQLQNQKDLAARERSQLLQRIDRVTRDYLPIPGGTPVPAPVAVFTAGFVRDYNLALGIPAAPAFAAAGLDPAAITAAGADAELLATGLAPADILAHIADYGERCRALEAQVTALIDVQTPEASP
ncbi:hypothetical protein [Lysobacter sp. CA196]|uniref:hypothetical protein n=1 Tax=Lysobacter sp. CA196 TaxID=3455606 RepID=UPI003F8D0D5D